MKDGSGPQTPRSLVVGPSWIGDMVIAHSLVQIVGARYRNPVDVLAPTWTHALLARMPGVDRVIQAPFEHRRMQIGRRFRVAGVLKSGGYDRAFVLPNSWKSALVPFLARIPTRTGFTGEQRYGLLNDRRHLDKTAMPLMAQRYAVLGRAPGETVPEPGEIPPPRLDPRPADAETAMERLSLSGAGPVLALCPGAEYGPAKQWPPAHFAEVARHYLDRDWDVWLFGSAGDRDAAAEIGRLCNERCRDLTGRTSLPEAIDLLARAALVISNDSGLMHVAAALGRPLIAVFGSTDPGHTPPMSVVAGIVRREDLACSPCFQRECPLEHLACLRGLEPGRVIDASAGLLDK